VTGDEDHGHGHDHDLREITAQTAQAADLVAMGFEEDAVVAALTATDKDFESALTLLLSGQDAAGDARADASASPWCIDANHTTAAAAEMPPADNAEAWPALGGAQVATSERVQLNSWEVVASRDGDAHDDGDGNGNGEGEGEGKGEGGEAAAAEAEAGVKVEAWEMVDEDDGEEGWEMTDASDADADADTDLGAKFDADANSDDDGAESTASSVVMVPPSTYLQALKLSTSVPDHSATLPENPCVAPARRQRVRGTAEAVAATAAASYEAGVIDDHTAQKDTHNHATRTRKSKQSAAKRLHRLAKKAEARHRR